MFSFLKPKPSYPAECKWVVYHGQWDGRPLTMRRNATAKQLVGHSDYCFRLGVAVPLVAPDERGLPQEHEMPSLNRIEDFLASAFEKQQNSLQVLAITTNSMCEFIFYTRTPRDIEATITEARTAFPDHEIQFYIAQDPKWEG